MVASGQNSLGEAEKARNAEWGGLPGEGARHAALEAKWSRPGNPGLLTVGAMPDGPCPPGGSVLWPLVSPTHPLPALQWRPWHPVFL